MKLSHVLIMVLCLLLSEAKASDVRLFGLSKGRRYAQAGIGAPVLQGSNSFEFRAFVELNRPNSVSTATLKYPGGTTRPLTNLVTAWRIDEFQPSMPDMNVHSPNGSYTMILQTSADGRRTNNFTVNGDFYPIPIHISNFAAAQQIDSTRDFILLWDPTSQDQTDFIQAQVLDNGAVVFETPDNPGAAGVIKGNSTSLTIPHTIFAQGHSYDVLLRLWKIVQRDTASYPGAYGMTGYITETEVPIKAGFSVLDVQWYGILKKQRYSQTYAGAPAALAQNGFEFDAFADAATPSSLSAGSVKLPNNTIKNLAGTNSIWLWSDSFTTQANLDNAYPSQIFALSLTTPHNGLQQIGLDLSTRNAYPGPAQISNWNDASSIDSSKPFLLTWTGFAGGTATDFVKVTIVRDGSVIFKTGDYPNAPGALSGTATSLTLPANLLKPGEACDATILFFRPYFANQFTYPGVTGVAGLGRETVATLRARGGTFPIPSVGQAQINADQFAFLIGSALTGRQYGIQSTPDFHAWTTIGMTNAPGTSFLFQAPLTQSPPVIGFRVFSN